MLNILVTILLLQIAYIDHKTMKIPDKLNFALGVCGLVSCIQNTDITITDRIFGFSIISVPLYILCLVIPEAHKTVDDSKKKEEVAKFKKGNDLGKATEQTLSARSIARKKSNMLLVLDQVLNRK